MGVIKTARKQKTIPLRVLCYGEVKEWKSRPKAMDYYIDAIAHSEGSERERYVCVYTQLVNMYWFCWDLRDTYIPTLLMARMKRQKKLSEDITNALLSATAAAYKTTMEQARKKFGGYSIKDWIELFDSELV